MISTVHERQGTNMTNTTKQLPLAPLLSTEEIVSVIKNQFRAEMRTKRAYLFRMIKLPSQDEQLSSAIECPHHVQMFELF